MVKKEEATVPVCSVVWEELCKAAAALSENYSPHQVSNFPPGSSNNNVEAGDYSPTVQHCESWPRRICSLALGRFNLSHSYFIQPIFERTFKTK